MDRSIDPDQLKDEILSEHRKPSLRAVSPVLAARCRSPIRNLDDEDLVENFWLLMRGYGLEDVYPSQQDGEIKIPSHLAKLSSDWMYEVDPEWNRRLSGGELLDNMIAGSGPAMTFAWPNTILPKVRNDPSIARRIGLHQFARQALLGTQVLAIPDGSGRHREQIEAAKAILTLTTNSQMQFILADLGSIPVLNDLPHRIELRNRPFWKENYAKMMEALAEFPSETQNAPMEGILPAIGRAAPQTPILRSSRTDAVHLNLYAARISGGAKAKWNQGLRRVRRKTAAPIEENAMKWTAFVLFVLAPAAAWSQDAAYPAEEIYDTQVFADEALANVVLASHRWPDCTTNRTAIRDIFRIEGTKSEEEKAIALWKWFRLLVSATGTYTYEGETPGREQLVQDPHKIFTVYGAHQCDGMSWSMAPLWRAAGYIAYDECHLGHTIASLRYRDDDGQFRFHDLDPQRRIIYWDSRHNRIGTWSMPLMRGLVQRHLGRPAAGPYTAHVAPGRGDARAQVGRRRLRRNLGPAVSRDRARQPGIGVLRLPAGAAGRHLRCRRRGAPNAQRRHDAAALRGGALSRARKTSPAHAPTGGPCFIPARKA